MDFIEKSLLRGGFRLKLLFDMTDGDLVGFDDEPIKSDGQQQTHGEGESETQFVEAGIGLIWGCH